MCGNKPDIVRTTTLEMCEAPGKYPSLQTKSSLAIMHASNIPLAFYRFMIAKLAKPIIGFYAII